MHKFLHVEYDGVKIECPDGDKFYFTHKEFLTYGKFMQFVNKPNVNPYLEELTNDCKEHYYALPEVTYAKLVDRLKSIASKRQGEVFNSIDLLDALSIIETYLPRLFNPKEK